MRVLVLIPSLYGTGPGTRFRVEQWARCLEPRGFQFTFAPFESRALHEVLYRPGMFVRKSCAMVAAFLKRFEAVLRARACDVVLLYREAALIGPALIERLLPLGGTPIVYDFDDPIWLPYRSPTNSFFSRLKFQSKTAAICRLADRVITGNRLLAAYAVEKGARAVDIVPSTIDLTEYPTPAPAVSREPVTLGWTGSHSTVPFLEQLQPVLIKLADRLKFRLVVISHNDSYRMNGLTAETVSRKWNAESEAGDLADVDIGLAPFPNTGWTPWRCHGKVLQYMALGIPTVASPIGIVPDYIEDGVDGFLADGPAQWLEKLEILIRHAQLRKTFGAASRSKLERMYSAQVWAPKVGEILEKAASRTP